MPVEAVCDVCGKRAPAIEKPPGWVTPDDWFVRGVDGRVVCVCCSEECVHKAGGMTRAEKEAPHA